MKKIFAITLLITYILCGCSKSDPKPPYFKDISWGSTIETIKEIEPDCEEESNGTETVLTKNDSTNIKDTGSDPIPFEPSMAQYTFEDNYLKSIVLSGNIESESMGNLEDWIGKYFDYKGEMNSGAHLYLSKEAPTTALAFEVLLNNISDSKDKSIKYKYIRITLLEYNVE